MLKSFVSGRHDTATRELRASVRRLESPPVAAPADDTLPTISVITPSFNQASFLERTLLSVLNQGYPRLELIVIDGGSTDGSINVIRKYQAHLAYWVSEPDRGQSDALNKGLRRATGEYVGWQNSDDLYFPGSLYKLARAAGRTRAPIVSGNLYIADEHNRIYREIRYTPMTRDSLRVIKASIPNQSALIRRDLFEQFGLVDEGKQYCMDLELWSRLLRAGSNVVVPDAFGVFTQHAENKTSTLDAIHRAERAQIIDEIRAEQGRMRLPGMAILAAKLFAHARQGDARYLAEKLLTKLARADDWKTVPK